MNFIRSSHPLPAGLLGALWLAGCAASGPELSGDSFPERARELLQAQADAGPVALVSALEYPDSATLAFAAEEGVRGLDVQFDPSLPADTRFRLVITRAPGNPCAAMDGSPNPAGEVLSVAFCRDEDAVATAHETIAEDVAVDIAASVRRASRQLFPDPYASQPGYGLFGRIGSGVSIGVGTSIGF